MGKARMLGLATDLYQLTMAAAYLSRGKTARATFELFVRKLPEQRSYLIAAGLEQALGYVRDLSFSEEETAYLRGLPIFSKVDGGFFDYLRDFRFSGEIEAVPEGRAVFAGEPLVRVTAPLIEAQIVETFLLATINFQTLIATKATRVVEAGQGRAIIEFGARRCHSFGAALYAARAAFIGGCVGTSNVEAGFQFGIPVFGTAAHSFTLAFEQEIDAFRAFYEVFPEQTTLLLDTYDTIRAAHLATEFGSGLRGVRIDSGDLGGLAREVREILDRAGMTGTKIMASSDLNEYKIDELVRSGAPIDLFGVGTDLSTSRDVPALGGVYKLVEIMTDGQAVPKMKLSREKLTYPRRKQVWRRIGDDGRYCGDTIGLADEREIPGEPLLQQVMVEGRIVPGLPTLQEVQAVAREEMERLPLELKSLHNPASYPAIYPVSYSARLEEERRKLQHELEE